MVLSLTDCIESNERRRDRLLEEISKMRAKIEELEKILAELNAYRSQGYKYKPYYRIKKAHKNDGCQGCSVLSDERLTE